MKLSKLQSFIVSSNTHLKFLALVTLLLILGASYFQQYGGYSDGGRTKLNPVPNRRNRAFIVPSKRAGEPPVLAYWIYGSSGDGQRIRRVLKAAYHPRNQYLLLLDASSSSDERADLALYVQSDPLFTAFDNVNVVGRSYAVNQMGASGLAALLHASALLLKLSTTWDWFIPLCATSHYPLMTQDDILHAFTLLPKDLNFVHFANTSHEDQRRVKQVVVDPSVYDTKTTPIFYGKQTRNAPNTFKILAVMALAFVKIIYDASPSSLPLPPFYNDAVRNLGFHVGHVTLRTCSQLWHVYIKVTTNGCFITDGWSSVFTDLGIEETDFIFFEVLPENTIHIYHFKMDRDLDVKENFYHVMMFPEAKNLWLPKKFMEHNFNDDLLENIVTIRYSPNQERTVRIKKLWDIHYYILDFSQISTDLALVKWDFLVFHRVETYTFNLIVFRLHGDGSLVAEMGIPLPEQQPIPEPEYEAENDIEYGIQHGVAEDQFPLEDVNVDNHVNVDNQESDDEDLPVHGNPPLPVNDVYEIEWILTYRFRFP